VSIIPYNFQSFPSTSVFSRVNALPLVANLLSPFHPFFSVKVACEQLAKRTERAISYCFYLASLMFYVLNTEDTDEVWPFKCI